MAKVTSDEVVPFHVVMRVSEKVTLSLKVPVSDTGSHGMPVDPSQLSILEWAGGKAGGSRERPV